MKTLFFSQSLASSNVDDVNAVIRGVSVITCGTARGHDLEVDAITLDQMQECAKLKGQVPVKVDHQSGAGSVCGFLTNFRRGEGKLKADWSLLKSHAQTPQILETARRMPGGVGLSVAFVSTPGSTSDGKPAARCNELISVDYVALPAANPDGLFSRRIEKERAPSGSERVHRVIAAGVRGAEAGALVGAAAAVTLRKPRLRSVRPAATPAGFLKRSGAPTHQFLPGISSKAANRAPLGGAILGGVGNATLQIARDRDERAGRRNFAAVPIPGADEADEVVRVARTPLIRRILSRAAKIGAGSVLGHYAGKKLGARAGAIAGATAGALFLDTRPTTDFKTKSAVTAGLKKSIDRHAIDRQPVGKLESHDLESLAERLLCPIPTVNKLIAEGAIVSQGPVHAKDEAGLHSFLSDDLNAIRRAVLSAIVERVANESQSNNAEEITLRAGQAMSEHVKNFGAKPRQFRPA